MTFWVFFFFLFVSGACNTLSESTTHLGGLGMLWDPEPRCWGPRTAPALLMLRFAKCVLQQSGQVRLPEAGHHPAMSCVTGVLVRRSSGPAARPPYRDLSPSACHCRGTQGWAIEMTLERH